MSMSLDTTAITADPLSRTLLSDDTDIGPYDAGSPEDSDDEDMLASDQEPEMQDEMTAAATRATAAIMQSGSLSAAEVAADGDANTFNPSITSSKMTLS